jgi:hypothetical protein
MEINIIKCQGNTRTFRNFSASCSPITTRGVCIVRGLTLLLRVGTLWRCGDGLLFEVLPLASDALHTTLHPLLENVLQSVCRKLQDSGTGGFDLGTPFSWLEKPINLMGA